MGDLSKNFSRSEFACHCGCGFDEPAPFLVVSLQELRGLIGKPIQVVSGCRCARHNAAVGGAFSSMHLQGKAADIKVTGMTPREIFALAVKVDAFRRGGLGLYKTWLHVDVRGYRARWGEDYGKGG